MGTSFHYGFFDLMSNLAFEAAVVFPLQRSGRKLDYILWSLLVCVFGLVPFFGGFWCVWLGIGQGYDGGGCTFSPL